jgi:hypothetical protein
VRSAALLAPNGVSPGVNELTGAATLLILLEVAPGDEEDFEQEGEAALHDFTFGE